MAVSYQLSAFSQIPLNLSPAIVMDIILALSAGALAEVSLSAVQGDSRVARITRL